MAKPPAAPRLDPKDLYDMLVANGVEYFCGVPDSLLSGFGFYAAEHAERHDIAANEGNAVGLAIGNYMASSKIPLVYMQNSGLSNALNPLLSLADTHVMSVPLLLLVGWRGYKDVQDEPQHVTQGAVTKDVLTAAGIPSVELSGNSKRAAAQIAQAARQAAITRHPYAILVQPNKLASYKPSKKEADIYSMTREVAIQTIAGHLPPAAVIVSTTGKASRELFEHRNFMGQHHEQDLLIVGGMGHASSVALGIAERKPGRMVCCIDGDGSMLMHMGALATIGAKKPVNFRHIVINNGSHDSVGGQPTVGYGVKFTDIAKACGYAYTQVVTTAAELTAAVCREDAGPGLIEVRVGRGSRPDLGRPTHTPAENKDLFMAFLSDE